MWWKRVSGLSLCLCLAAACGGGGGVTPEAVPDESEPLVLNVRIVETPDDTTAESEVAFRFECDAPDALFEVSIDGSEFSLRAATFRSWRLDDGIHTITVRALSADGTPDTGPSASFTWRQDSTPPEAAVHFPPPVSGTDQSVVAVRGSASDATPIDSIRVNGVEAVSADGFRTWKAVIPVDAAATKITVDAADKLGNVVRSTHGVVSRTIKKSLRPEPLYDVATTILFDAPRDRLLVLAAADRALLALDPVSGDVTEISGPGRGTGPEIVAGQTMVIDTDLDKLLLFDRHELRLFEIDLDSGDRSIRVDLEHNLETTSDGFMVRGGSMVWLQGTDSGHIGRINLTTEVAHGMHIVPQPVGLAFESETQLLSFNGATDQLLGLHQTTGVPTVLSDHKNEKTRVGRWRGMVFNADTRTVTAVASSGTGLVTIDIDTGSRTFLAFADEAEVHCIALAAGVGVLYALDHHYAVIHEIDVESGEVRELTNPARLPSRTPLPNRDGLVRIGKHAFSVTPTSRVIVERYELGTDFAKRTLTYSCSSRSRPGVAADPDGGGLLVFDGRSLERFDLETLRPETIARFEGTTIDAECWGALATSDTEAFVQGTIGPMIAVSLDTHEQRVVVEEGWAGFVPDLAIDGDRVLAVDSKSDEFLAVDPTTGEVSVVSESASAALRIGVHRGIAVHDGHAYLIAASGSSLVRIDLQNGVRTELKLDAGFAEPRGIVIDEFGNTAYVMDVTRTNLVAIDLNDGSVIEVESRDEDTLWIPEVEPSLTRLGAPIDCDATRGELLVVDAPRNQLVRIDCATGDIEDASNIANLEVRAFHVDRDAFYAVAAHARELSRVSLITGRAYPVRFSEDRAVAGTLGVHVESDGRHAIVVSGLRECYVGFGLHTVHRVHIVTGESELLSTRTVDSLADQAAGPVTVDEARGRILLGTRRSLLALTSSGTTTLASGFGRIVDIAHDPVGNRTVVLEMGHVIRVDPVSGSKTVISSEAKGVGPSILGATGIAIDAAQGLAFVTQATRVLVVDLETGDRAVVAEVR